MKIIFFIMLLTTATAHAFPKEYYSGSSAYVMKQYVADYKFVGDDIAAACHRGAKVFGFFNYTRRFVVCSGKKSLETITTRAKWSAIERACDYFKKSEKDNLSPKKLGKFNRAYDACLGGSEDK